MKSVALLTALEMKRKIHPQNEVKHQPLPKLQNKQPNFHTLVSVSYVSHIKSLASKLVFSAGKNPAANSLSASDDRSEGSGLD